MQNMLSGLRVVRRDEVTAKSQHTGVEQTTEESQKRSKRHGKERKGKGKSKRRRNSRRSQTSSDEDYRNDDLKEKHGRRKSSKHKGRSSSDSSTDCDVKRGQLWRKKFRGRYSDRSSATDAESGESRERSDTSDGMSDDMRERSAKSQSIAARKAAGLEWMTKAPRPSTTVAEPEETIIPVPVEEKFQANPKELNPYLKDGGDGYPSEEGGLRNMGGGILSRPPVVGDGGLSWRLKALKRAKEQAEREGRKLDEVVEERWGSLAEMTMSVSARRAAHSHAHLHAIRDRKSNTKDGKLQGQDEECLHSIEPSMKLQHIAHHDRDSERISSFQGTRMKVPRNSESLSWKSDKSRYGHSMRTEDAEIVRAAASSLNKFSDDGSFLSKFKEKQALQDAVDMVGNRPDQVQESCSEGMDRYQNADKPAKMPIPGMSANQLAAKAIQLRLRGKSQEADELLKQMQNLKQLAAESSEGGTDSSSKHSKNQAFGPSLKSIMSDYEQRARKKDGDAEVIESILHNKLYSRSTSIEDEYDFGTGLEDSKHRKPKKESKNEALQAIRAHKRIITQQERCQFCFDNPSRPKHLTISIANSTYLMLPPREPLVEGHCFIVPMQHEGSSRNVDENVWEELRNYKKCLLRMFADQDKDVLFMETAIALARQRRHCLLECIPLPRQVSKQAPLYFKKAIDEAEDEWSQHNAKKLIDTSTKGLRACIPKYFPYFHVEFGLHAGYVHVIDNENDFKSHFGRDVVIGILKLPEEEMYRRRRQESYEQQKQSAVEFQKMWDPYDWTKMLD